MALGSSLPARIAESTGTVYYVGGAGAADSNAGTDPAAPWATIGKAITAMAGNGIAKVRAGTYTENNAITSGNTSTTVKTIMAQSGRGSVIIRGKIRIGA